MNIESITPKLNYLNHTKELIKEALIEKGVEVTDTDTFRSYAEKIENMEVGGKAVLPPNAIITFADIPAGISPTGQDIIVDDLTLDIFFDSVDTSHMFYAISFYDSVNDFVCEHITTAPLFDTSNCRSFRNMFFDCSALENVPVYDTSNAVEMKYMFSGCYNLTDESLNNILLMCINATNISSSNKDLYTIITSDAYPTSRIETLPAYQDFVDAGWILGNGGGK